jgi:hypothetical protein
MFNCIESADRTNYLEIHNYSFKYLCFFLNNKIYIISLRLAAGNEKQTNTDVCRVSVQFKLLTKIVGGNWLCQRYNVPNRQHIKDTLKLYCSLLGKYRYTSLELAVGRAGLMADLTGDFRAYNPVKVGSRDNNREQCHQFWQCQTIVDS